MHLLGLVVALVLLLAVALLTYLTSRQYTQWASQARRVHSTLLNLKNLLIDLQIAESSERGYLLTGSGNFLAEYRSARRRADGLLSSWDESSIDYPDYLARKAQFKSAVNNGLTLLDDAIALQTSGSLSSELLSSIMTRGLDLMQGALDVERQLDKAQEDALFYRRAHAQEYARFSQLIATIGCSGVFALLLLSTVRIHALISTHSRLTAEVAKSEEEFRKLADAVPQMIWRTTALGDLEYVNAGWREFSGMPAMEGSQAWPELLHPDDRDDFVAKWKRSLNIAGAYVSQCRLRDRCGRYKWFLFRTTPVRDVCPGGLCWYCTFTDIDDQKNTERALHRANEELRQFAYVAAHDLQEPLRNVSSLLGLLRLKHPEQLTDPAGQWVNETVENAKRMHSMVKDLLAYARALDTHDGAMRADSSQSIIAAAANLQRLIDETGARLHCEGLPALSVLPNHLVQLFQAILSNALKFRKPDELPVIQIAAKSLAHEWLFSVCDNGIGFEPAYAERIFGVFKRLHTAGEYPGTGIGLAICSRIVGHYGGRIWAESIPGEGATFYFTLPRLEEQQVSA